MNNMSNEASALTFTCMGISTGDTKDTVTDKLGEPTRISEGTYSDMDDVYYDYAYIADKQENLIQIDEETQQQMYVDEGSGAHLSIYYLGFYIVDDKVERMYIADFRALSSLN